jgi:hypothetical protein
MSNTFDYFKGVIIMQLFWAFAFGILTLTIPATDLPQLAVFTFQNGSVDLATIGTSFQDAVINQTNIPLLDYGALVFYSGNIILDLILNFFFAIPEMATMLISAVFMFVPIAGGLETLIKSFLFAFIGVMYVIGLLAFVSNIRSGANII